MKELNSFTVERLEKISNSAFYYAGAEMEEIRALARIALAAKRAEPVTWWTGPEPTLTGELESFHDHETGSHYLPLISLSTTSYAALSREKFIFKVTNFLCTRRQSIAREGETAALIYDMVTTPQLNSPEIPEGWIKCSDQMPDDSTDVTLFHPEIGVFNGYCWRGLIKDKEPVFFSNSGEHEDGPKFGVTHWMPLPAAPEMPL